MKATMFRTAIALSAICFAFAAEAISNTEPPKPMPPLQKNFPLDQTWQLKELNGKPIPADVDASLKIDSALRGPS